VRWGARSAAKRKCDELGVSRKREIAAHLDLRVRTDDRKKSIPIFTFASGSGGAWVEVPITMEVNGNHDPALHLQKTFGIRNQYIKSVNQYQSPQLQR
jgi:hypothetical protein